LKKLYLITGEPSGDLHASNFLKELRKQEEEYLVYAWGGPKLESAGAVIRKHYKDLAFMGFWEVIKNIFTILKNFKECKQDILTFQPDAVILVDYPGFNLRMAKWCHQRGFKVIYYISPQIWAWKESRANSIKKYVDKMYVILPFEQAFYAKWEMQVDFVGHPLLDEIKQLKASGDSKMIALLPGSRKQEIENTLPIFLKMVAAFPDYQFVVAGLSHIGKYYYEAIIKEANCVLRMDETYKILSEAECALVTSGTATLETALMEVPQIVCYKGGWLNYQLGKRLIKVPFISLVNLIMGRKIVEELIQDELNEKRLKSAIQLLLKNKKETIGYYKILKQKLGGPGASARLAASVHHFLQQ
jgi:lipid-A-disaccharide synthase